MGFLLGFEGDFNSWLVVWNILEHFGTFWNILEHVGTFWNILEHFGTFLFFHILGRMIPTDTFVRGG